MKKFGLGCLFILCCTVLIVFVMALHTGMKDQENKRSKSISGATRPATQDDADLIIGLYGPPDSTDSTAYDQPRPPMVSKWLVYKKARVKFLFLADAPLGAPPPYTTWKLVGAIDLKKNVALTAKEMERKMTLYKRLK